MAAQSERAIPSEETFHLLREKAKADGDSFTVKVWRRQHIGAVPELAASLSDAMVEHFNNPELWLPLLCGGGNYTLQGYHPTDLGKPVGGMLQYKLSSEPKEIDGSVLKKSEWRGPAKLDYPQMAPARDRAADIYELRSPPAPGDSSGLRSATSSNQIWNRQAGGGHSQEYNGESPWQERQRLQGALETEKRKLDEERLANEREKHRNELDALKKAHEADMARLEARLMGVMQQKPTGPDPSAVMFETVMKMQAESARLATEDRREREKQAAEDRRAAELRQERNDDRFNKLLEKMSERPKEDPLAMIEKVTNLVGKNNSNEAQMKMMGNMAEMHSVQMGTAMDFIQAAAELQLGAREKEESPIIKGIEAAVKGVAAMAKGAQMKRAPQQFAQPQIPPTYEQQARAQQPAPPPPQPAQPQRAAPTILEQLENGIRGKADVKVVAKAIVNHIKDPSVQSALVEVGFDFEVLIQNRLGIWAKEHVENEAYLKQLMTEVENELRAAGYIQPEESEPDAQVEEGDGEEE